jgi:hypothetical protein
MSETISDTTQGAVETEIAPQPATEIVPATGTEQPASPPEGETETEQKPKQTPWFQRRIDELTREKYEFKRQADAHAESLRKIQQGTPAPAQATQPPAGFVPASEVEKIAAKVVEERSFVQACNDIHNAGLTAYQDFDDAVSNYKMLGPFPDDFLETLTELGKEAGAKVYYDLGKNPDDASRIFALPRRRMIMELQRMALVAPKPLPVSKAPPPIAPIRGGDVRTNAEPDPKDIKAWNAWYDKELASRRNR